jgi:hypothetical protein
MHIDVSGGWRERYMFDKDGPIGRGECLPDISMYAALIRGTYTDTTGKMVQ